MSWKQQYSLVTELKRRIRDALVFVVFVKLLGLTRNKLRAKRRKGEKEAYWDLGPNLPNTVSKKKIFQKYVLGSLMSDILFAS